jgi:hypothetical protein
MYKSRRLHSKRKDREGEHFGADIAGLGWLNDRPSKARLRVARLIELLKDADLKTKNLRRASSSTIRSQENERDRRSSLDTTLEGINDILGQYRGARAIWLNGADLEEIFCLDRKRLERDGYYYTETIVINYALGLLRRGSIQRVRVCRECGKWHYAMTDHQLYCSSKCRQRSASHDSTFQERRREYMREYRKREREREEHLRQAVKRTK